MQFTEQFFSFSIYQLGLGKHIFFLVSFNSFLTLGNPPTIICSISCVTKNNGKVEHVQQIFNQTIFN